MRRSSRYFIRELLAACGNHVLQQ